MAVPAAGKNGTTASPFFDTDNTKLSDPLRQGQQKEGRSLVNLVPALMRVKRRWRALVDGDTGSTYYVDEATGVSQWEKPPPEEITPSVGTIEKDPTTSSTTQHRREENSSPLVGVVPALMRAKRKWLALVDDSTGSTYYIDEVTGTAQWERPPEVDGGPPAEEDEIMVDDPQGGAPNIESGRASTGGRGGIENDSRPAPEAVNSVEWDDHVVKPVGFGDGENVKLPGEAAEVAIDNDLQGSGDGDSLLQRADSNSTLSTYGGELESLAKYVTGHSTTLDRGVVVEPELPNNGKGGSGGGKSISDAGEDTAKSTDLSDENRHSTSESDSETEDGEVSTHTKSSAHATGDSPSLGVDADTTPQGDYSPREQRQLEQQAEFAAAPEQQAEFAAHGGAASSTQSNDQHSSEILADTSSQQESFPIDGDDGMDKGGAALIEHRLFAVDDVRASEDKPSPSVPAEPDGTGNGAGTALAAEAIVDEVRGRQEPHTGSTPPTGDIHEASGNDSRELSTKLSGGAIGVSYETMPAKPSPSPRDEGQAKAPSALLSGTRNENNIATPSEPIVGDRPLLRTVTAAAKTPLSFDTAAVTAMALARLKAGMQLRRQEEASVKLHAVARGWAARRLCARLVERRETRRREEREAKERAATAIQAAVRGTAGRNKAQQAQRMRTELQIQQARLRTTPITDKIGREESVSQREIESLTPGLGMESKSSHLRLERNNDQDGIRALELEVSPERSAQNANRSSSFDPQKEESRTASQAAKEGNTREDTGHPDSAEPNAATLSEGEPQWREPGPGTSGHDGQYCGQEQDMLSLQLSHYGGVEGRFEPGPLGTIDEEGHQRNEHLWGGDGVGEAEHGVEETSPEDDETRTDSGFSSGPPELTTKADTLQDSPGRSSENSDGDFEEASTSDGDLENYADSNERRYDGSSRTSISSKTAAPPTEGSDSSGMTDSGGSDGHDNQVSTGDGDFYPPCNHPYAEPNDEERVEEHHQQTSDRMAWDETAGATARCRDGSQVPPAESDNPGQTAEEFGVSEGSKEGGRARGGVYQDTTAPMNRLEDLRSLVAAQAQATARATMTAVGTDASRLEANHIRCLEKLLP